MNKKELQAKRAEAVAAARALVDKADAEKRSMTADEQKVFDDHMGRSAALEADIARCEKLEAAETAVKTVEPRKVGTVGREDQIVDYARPRQTLRCFRGQDADVRAHRVGMWLIGLAAPDGSTMQARARQYCREQGLEFRTAAAEGDDALGGFLVPPEFSSAIIDLREEYGTWRQNCRVQPMSRDILTIPRATGGLTAYFIGENAAMTESNRTWNQVQLTARKLAILAKFSTELAEDAVINIADDLVGDAALRFAAKEDDCGWNGDGTPTYGGIVGLLPKIIDGTHTAGAVDVATATHNLFSEIDHTDLVTLMAKLPKYALRSAKWFCSQLAFSTVFSRLTTAAGGIVNFGAGVPPSYLGYPIITDQTMPAGAATDYDAKAMLVFGDLALAATLGDRRQITVQLLKERYAEYGQLALIATERFDIVVHDLGDTATAGPVVALIGSSS